MNLKQPQDPSIQDQITNEALVLDKERHDQLSRDIRITGLILFAYSIFCFVTLSQVDEIIKTRNVEIPLAEFPVKFSSFLTFGPSILLIITFYLHLFIWELKAIKSITPEMKLPFTFNMATPPAQILSSLIFYGLPPFVLLFFSYRAYVWAIDLIDVWGIAAFLCFVGMGLLRLKHIDKGSYKVYGLQKIPYRVKRLLVMGFIFIGCSLAILAISGKLNQMFPLDLVRVELSNQKIARLNLNNANLFAANIKEAIFLQTSLQGANLVEANLEGADLQKIKLNGAKLRKANLMGANLKGASLKEAKLNGANLEDANLERVNFKGSDLKKANLKGAVILATNLTDAKNLTCEQLKSANVQKFLLVGSKKKETRFPKSLEITWDVDGRIKDCFQGLAN